MLRAISLLLALALATIGAGTLAPSSALEASSHSAVRSFSQSWAPPGGRLVVTITATNYGGFGQVEETLPEGFSFTGSSLSEGSVTVDGQTVSFVLLGDGSFTYTVDVPDEEGAYTFSGVLKDANREESGDWRSFSSPGWARTDGDPNVGARGNSNTHTGANRDG